MSTPRRLYVYDSRVKWQAPALAAARARGWDARKLGLYDQPDEPGYAMVNVHADPEQLPADRELAHRCAARGLKLVTDLGQVDVYERKREQVRRWRSLMPPTSILEQSKLGLGYGLDLVDLWDLPVVSKADVGASSYNVRILCDQRELHDHVRRAFTPPGIPVRCCAGERRQHHQLGYVILQEFVPHEHTYRVNVVGDQRAIFLRHNHPTRGTAQTGNVTPVGALTPEFVDLLEWVDEKALPAVRSKWVALDVLKHPERGWVLLETSLRWPHPGARDCDEKAHFFKREDLEVDVTEVGDEARQTVPGHRWETRRPFGEMWETLLDELEAGAFDA